MRYLGLFLVVMLALTLGCKTGGDHQKGLHSGQEREMTLGTAQREIRVGMSQADVATALGSPNIVSKDSEGDETWIYDKIATEVSYSQDSTEAAARGGTLTGVGSWIVGLSGSAKQKRSAGARSTTQKTLTVVVKFDKQGKVKNLAYHSSKF